MSVSQLWLPILVSAVVVFVASSLAWMVLPHHKADIKKLPDEKAWFEQLGQANLAAGTYMWPNAATPAEGKTEEFRARYAAGPWGSVNIQTGQPNFGRNLLLVFLIYGVIGTLVAYLTGRAHGAGAGFGAVFPVATAAAILGYCIGSLPGAIFMAKPARFVFTDFVDALAYAVLTGIVFAALWPSAAKAATSGVGQ